ncbi:MAG: type II secretion system protein [Pirellulales bacterium]
MRGRRSSLNSRSGMTLVELVVVLAILAMLAGIAVRSMNAAAEQVRYECTRSVLEQSRIAILGDRMRPDHEPDHYGYFSDCGSLPSDLDDLLSKPIGITARSLFTFDSDRDGTNDVSLSGGWNGPYLHPGVGQATIVDGWGRSITLSMDVDDLVMTSTGSDSDSTAPEDGYAADIAQRLTANEMSGDLVCRLFAIDSLIGSRIDPSPTGTQQLGILLYAVGAAGSVDGSVEELLIAVPNSGSFELRHADMRVGRVAVRAILWDDLDSDDHLDLGETIDKKSYVHYGSISGSGDLRLEMELR